MRTLSSTNRVPDYTRARPGHRAVSIRMDCVLVVFIPVLQVSHCVYVSLYLYLYSRFHLVYLYLSIYTCTTGIN